MALSKANTIAHKETPATASSELTPGAHRAGEMAGRYQVMQLIGRGAFGEVLLAHDPNRPNHKVALKMVSCDLTDIEAAARARDATLAEAEILRRLRHPHIVECEDACWDTARCVVWLALEFMDGGSAQQAIDSRRSANGRPFEAHFVRRLLVSVGTALRYTHSAGVLHRDVKPANILISRPSMHIKLADFGISKLLEVTGHAHTVVGTPYYFSPEIVSGQAYGPGVDCWALGVCMYEMARLKRPFEAGNPLALARKICEEPPAPLPPETEPDIVSVVAGMLVKEPLQRVALADALRVSDEVTALLSTDGSHLKSRTGEVQRSESSGTIEEVVCFSGHLSTQSPTLSPRPHAFAEALPEEKKDKKKEKGDKDRGVAKRWFRFKKTFRSAAGLDKEDADGEVTMVSAFTDECEKGDTSNDDPPQEPSPTSRVWKDTCSARGVEMPLLPMGTSTSNRSELAASGGADTDACSFVLPGRAASAAGKSSAW